MSVLHYVIFKNKFTVDQNFKLKCYIENIKLFKSFNLLVGNISNRCFIIMLKNINDMSSSVFEY